MNGHLLITEEPFSDAETVEWSIPEQLDQFDLVNGMVCPQG